MSKVVLITGCSTGIGLKLAVRLSNDKNRKYRVYATMRNLNKQSELVIQIGDNLDKTTFIRKLDVSKKEEVETVVQEILKNEGKIDILVNNAGMGLVCAFETMSMDLAQQTMDTNFFGTMRCMQICIPIMKRQGNGHVINVSSIGGVYGLPCYGVYSATKFAVEGLSESLAPELRQFGIFISLIEPGSVDTPFIYTWANMRKNMDEQVDEVTKGMVHAVANTILNRPLKARQPADGVVDVIIRCMNDRIPSLRYPTSASVQHASKQKLVDTTGDTVIEYINGIYPIIKKD